MSCNRVGFVGCVTLLASLSLNVALISGCVCIDGTPPYVHGMDAARGSRADARLSRMQNESLERLRSIASLLGMDTQAWNDPVSLKGAIVQRLLDGETKAPGHSWTDQDLDRICKELTRGESEVREACEFVMKLKGKKVFVIEEGPER